MLVSRQVEEVDRGEAARERRDAEWERGLGPADERSGPGPVRQIPVTLAMQQADQRRQQQQLAPNPDAAAWRARVRPGRPGAAHAAA